MKSKTELEKEVSNLTSKLNAEKNRCLRLQADFDGASNSRQQAIKKLRDVKQQANHRGDILKTVMEKLLTWNYNL